MSVKNLKKVIVRPGHHVPGSETEITKANQHTDQRAIDNLLIISVKAAFELVKNIVILVERAELRAKILVDEVRLDGSRVHIEIPHFH